jgi:sugar fermentation stimulation protein A
MQAGDRCVMFYLIQRTDANIFKPADHIDFSYGKTLRSVFSKGVEIMVYDVHIDLKTIELNKPIPYQL